MKHSLPSILVLTAATLYPVPGDAGTGAPAIAVHQDPVQVVVLGTFHMGAEPDELNPNVVDLLQERRQKELDALVAQLAAFQPTKVALEALPSSTLQADYTRYLEDKLSLRRDERHQVGFRLARRLGHERIHCVDHELPIDILGILAKAKAQGQGARVAEFMSAYRKASSKWSSEFMSKRSILEIYLSFNSTKIDAANHDVFASMIALGSEERPVGAMALSRWHERNLRIAANIVHIAKPGDRILVLIGANHRKLLIEALKNAPGIEVKPARKLLGGS